MTVLSSCMCVCVLLQQKSKVCVPEGGEGYQACPLVSVCDHTGVDHQQLCPCVCVCVCVYLPSCNIKGLSYTRVVLSLYLYLSSFSCSWCVCVYLLHNTRKDLCHTIGGKQG